MEREHIIDETCRIRTVTTSDRRGQDKARKVRAVGRDGLRREIPAIRQTLRNIDRTLRCFGTRYRRSIFDTL
jgi:hypothetical protein